MFKDVDFVKKWMIWCNAFDVNNYFLFDLIIAQELNISIS